jgi:hypothetical protein
MVVHTDVRVWDQAVFVPIPSVNPMVVPTKAPTRDRSIVFFIPSVTPMVMPNNALVWYQDVFFYPVCESHVRAYRCTSGESTVPSVTPMVLPTEATESPSGWPATGPTDTGPPCFPPASPAPSYHRPLSPTSVLWHPSAPKVTQDSPLDELDTLIQEASTLFQSTRGEFHPDVGKVPHPAAHLINCFRIAGTPFTCRGVPWTFAQKAAALTRGPHQSARQHLPFLR